MRIVTYNIHGWRTAAGDAANFDQLVRTLAALNADLIGLNEVVHPQPLAPGNPAPALDALAQALGMQSVFGPCLRWPATDRLPEKSYGNALLSRRPVLASAAHHLAHVPDKEQRGLLETRVLGPDDKPFTVYVTHLDHTDEDARLAQVRSLHAWTVRDRNRPHVVMGDFNAVAPWDFAQRRDELARLAAGHPQAAFPLEEEAMQVIPRMEKAGYVDAMRAVGQAGQSTFIPAPFPLRIDYIFLSQPLAPALESAQVWIEPRGEEASDHRPVVVDLRDS